MTAFASASRCKRSATSSSAALHALSTRAGFALLVKAHSLILLDSIFCGTSTFTFVVAELLRPRASVHVVVTVTAPAPAPSVESVPFMPSPATVPELALHDSGCSWALSGLVQVQEMVEG